MTRATVRLSVWPIAAIVALVLIGCSGETWNWDAFGRSEPSGPQKPTPPRERQPQERTASTPTPAEPQEDPETRDMNAKIDQYVENMSRLSQNDYVPNDINSKIARQQDPERKRRISRAAEQTKVRPARTEQDPQIQPANEAELPAAGSTGHAVSSQAPAQPGESSPSRPEPDQPKPNPEAAVATANEPADSDTAGGKPAIAEEDEPLVDDRVVGPAPSVEEPRRSAAAEETIPARKERPPVLEEVRVSPAESPSTDLATPEQTRPTANPASPPREPIDTFQQKLESLEAKVRAEPNNYGDQFKLRMMYLLAGQEEKATGAINGTDADLQELIIAHFKTLLAAQAGSGRDAALAANRQLGELENLRDLVRAKADLQVPKVVVCSAIEGFGRYTPIEPAEFQAGQKNRILLYIEVDNFVSEKTASGMYRTLLSVRQSLLTKAGEEMWTTQDSNIEDLARQQRRDFYLTVGPLSIPATLAAGEYVLKVEVEDVLAGKLNSNVARFRLLP